MALSISKVFELVNGNKGKIGPHEGRIVELMLNGTKPVCSLGFPNDREDIIPLLEAVNNGQLSMMRSDKTWVDEFGQTHEDYYFCQPDKEADMQQLMDLNDCDKSNYNMQAWLEFADETGKLLGYSEEDIAFYKRRQASPIVKASNWYHDKISQFFPPQSEEEEPGYDCSPLPLKGPGD